MTLRPPEDIVAARPDGAVAFAGDEGNLMLQDGAKAVFRGGVTQQNGDFGERQWDLVGDGDLIIPLDDVGGASLINASLVSLGDSSDGAFDQDPEQNPTDASRPFNVIVEDLKQGADAVNPDESDVLDRRRPASGDDVERTRLALGLFSDNGRVIVEHGGLDTGENLINATFNIQSGSTDALQIRGPDGTVINPAGDAALSSIGDGLSDVADAVSAAQTTLETNVVVGDTNSLGDPAQSGDVLASLDTLSSSVISINIDAEAAIDVQYQTSTDGVTWFDNVTTPDASTDSELTGITSLRDDLETGSRYVRVVLDTPATGEARADIAIEASG
jgi:hypothetical protein